MSTFCEACTTPSAEANCFQLQDIPSMHGERYLCGSELRYILCHIRHNPAVAKQPFATERSKINGGLAQDGNSSTSELYRHRV